MIQVGPPPQGPHVQAPLPRAGGGLQAGRGVSDCRVPGGHEVRQDVARPRADPPHRQHHEHRLQERTVRRLRHQLPPKAQQHKGTAYELRSFLSNFYQFSVQYKAA